MRIPRRKEFPVSPSMTGSGSHEESGKHQLEPRRLLGGPSNLGGEIVGGIIKFGKAIAEAGAGHDNSGGPPDGAGGGGPAGGPAGGGPAGGAGGAGGAGAGGAGGKGTDQPTSPSPPSTSTSSASSSLPTSSSTATPTATSTTTTGEGTGSSVGGDHTTQAEASSTSSTLASNTVTGNPESTVFTLSSTFGTSRGQSTAASTSPLPSRPASDVPSSPTALSSTPVGSTGKSTLSGSAIGGIVAGVVIAILAIILVVLVCFRRRRALNAASQNLSFEKAYSYPFTGPRAAAGVAHNIGRPILPPSPESIRRFDPALMVGPGRSPSRSSSTLSSLGRIFVATRRNPRRVLSSEGSAPSSSVAPSIRSTTQEIGRGPSKSRWSTTVEGELHSPSSATNESGGSRSEENGTTAWKPLPNPFETSRFSADVTAESSDPNPFGDSHFSGDSSAESSESSASGHSRGTV